MHNLNILDRETIIIKKTPSQKNIFLKKTNKHLSAHIPKQNEIVTLRLWTTLFIVIRKQDLLINLIIKTIVKIKTTSTKTG